MAFTMTLYKNSAENERVNKASYLKEPKQFSGTLRDSTSVISPTIRIVTNDNISTYNYCEIPLFGRKYYITDITSVRTGVWDVSLKCDVLYTYMEQIGLCQGIINKAEADGRYNKMLNDGTFKTTEEEVICQKPFPNKLVKYDGNGHPLPVWMICLTI